MKSRQAVHPILTAIAMAAGMTIASAPSAASTIHVAFEFSASTIKVGESVTVNVMAHGVPPIDPNDPGGLVAWGMELSFDEAIVSHDPHSQLTLGSLWDPAPDGNDDGLPGISGDGLAGLFTQPDIDQVPSGDSIHLATFEFIGAQVGETELTGFIDFNDPFQGFTPLGGGFYDVSFESAFVKVIPLPAPVVMGLTGLAAVMVLRRRRIYR